MAEWSRNVNDIRVKEEFFEISSDRFHRRFIRGSDVDEEHPSLSHVLMAKQYLLMICQR
jgi:hypothetical protein